MIDAPTLNPISAFNRRLTAKTISPQPRPETLKTALRFGITPKVDTGDDGLPFDTGEALAVLGSYNAALQVKRKAVPDLMRYDQFLTLLMADPMRYLPKAGNYMGAALRAPGQTPGTKVMGHTTSGLQFQNAPWEPADLLKNRGGVYGQDLVIEELAQVFDSFDQAAKPDRFIVLYGPHGSGKTKITKTVAAAAEDYSTRDQGALFTFRWVFGKNPPNPDAGPFGLGAIHDERVAATKGTVPQVNMIPNEDVDYVIPSHTRANPIFILPKEHRAELFRRLKKEGKIPEHVNLDFYIKGDLDAASRNIRDTLLRDVFNNDVTKMLAHIQVTRWQFSVRDNVGSAFISAGETPDAHVEAASHSDDLGAVPSFIRTYALQKVQGPLADANGGLMIFDDIGKGHPDRLTYLLDVDGDDMPIGNGGSSGVRESLQTVYLGTANPDSLAQLRNIKALTKRMVFIPVPYVRQYREEAKIYEPSFSLARSAGRQFSDDVLLAFSLWGTMTRLKPIDNSNPIYSGAALDARAAVRSVTEYIQKAMLYQGEDPTAYWTRGKTATTKLKLPPYLDHLAETHAQDLLRQNVKLIAREHNQRRQLDENMDFEGGSGLDPRQGSNIVRAFIQDTQEIKRPLMMLDMIDYLGRSIRNGLSYKPPEQAEMVAQPESNVSTPTPPSQGGGRPKGNSMYVSPDDVDLGPLESSLDRRSRQRYTRIKDRKDKLKFLESEGAIDKWRQRNQGRVFPFKANVQHKYGHLKGADPAAVIIGTEPNQGPVAPPVQHPTPVKPAQPQPTAPCERSQQLTLLMDVEDYYRRRLITDIKSALGLYRTEEQYIEDFQRYIEHAKTLRTGAHVPAKYRLDARKEKADEAYMKKIEAECMPPDTQADTFRVRVGIRLSDWNRGISDADNIKTLFADELARMKTSEESKGSEKLTIFNKFQREVDEHGLNWYFHPDTSTTATLDTDRDKDMRRFKTAVDTLLQNPAYRRENAAELMVWAFKQNDYVADGSFVRPDDRQIPSFKY